MKRLATGIVLSAILLLIGTGCNRTVSDQGEESSPVKDVMTAITAQYTKISPYIAQEMMKEEGVVIVDVRTQSEYESGHIRGAILIPNETISEDRMPEELPDKNQTILVYCRSGNRSAQAARKLVSQGYINVYDFGGINTWPGELVQ